VGNPLAMSVQENLASQSRDGFGVQPGQVGSIFPDYCFKWKRFLKPMTSRKSAVR
jgi:hypothetical protein